MGKTEQELLRRLDASPYKRTSVEWGVTRNRKAYGRREVKAAHKLIDAGILERVPWEIPGPDYYDYRNGRHATGHTLTLRRKE